MRVRPCCGTRPRVSSQSRQPTRGASQALVACTVRSSEKNALGSAKQITECKYSSTVSRPSNSSPKSTLSSSSSINNSSPKRLPAFSTFLSARYYSTKGPKSLLKIMEMDERVTQESENHEPAEQLVTFAGNRVEVAARPHTTRIFVVHPILDGKAERAIHHSVGIQTIRPPAVDENGTRLSYKQIAPYRLAEAVGLAEALGWDVVYKECHTVHHLHSNAFFGQGKIEELKSLIQATKADVVFVDTFLTPPQVRHLIKSWGEGLVVFDRFAIILEIFAERAQTKESKLQVELAYLQYKKAHLAGGYARLVGEQQRGSTATIGGPGEKMLELDRRRVARREQRVKKDLEEAKKHRDVLRQGRKKFGTPIVSIIGYTNAGKSALVNRITKSELVSYDQVFASLEPHMRAGTLPSGQKAIFLDSVGFISDLPHSLVAPFKSTLESIADSSLLVHLRDISHVETEFQKLHVQAILKELDLNPSLAENYIEVWNKMDLLFDKPKTFDATVAAARAAGASPVSVLTDDGMENLLMRIDRALLDVSGRKMYEVIVKSADEALVHYLYNQGSVMTQEAQEDNSIRYTVILNTEAHGILMSKYEPAKVTEIAARNLQKETQKKHDHDFNPTAVPRTK